KRTTRCTGNCCTRRAKLRACRCSTILRSTCSASRWCALRATRCEVSTHPESMRCLWGTSSCKSDFPMRSLFLCLLGVPILYAQSPGEKEDLPNPVAGQADAIAAGKKLDLEGCTHCHGNIAQGEQIRGATNRHLLSIITDGVKGSDMPPSGLPSDKVWQIVAYLRNLTAVAFDSMAAGDVQAGSALFFGKAGCANCHTIRGRGGFPGPDLSNIGRVRSFRQLRESLLDPNAQIAEGYGGVTVTTKSGQTISGVARDNTNYAIQILDAQGDVHRLLKADLREAVFRKSSLMPGDFKQRLSSTEIEDLLAF